MQPVHGTRKNQAAFVLVAPGGHANASLREFIASHFFWRMYMLVLPESRNEFNLVPHQLLLDTDETPEFCCICKLPCCVPAVWVKCTATPVAVVSWRR